MTEYVNIVEKQEPVQFSKTIRRVIKEENWDDANNAMHTVVPRRSFYTLYGKRILDVILSLPAVIVTLPVNFVLLICTILDVGFPIFFSQERIGKDMKPFMLVKFRNMNNKKNQYGELLPADLRVSKFGRFVRKTSLDELLNFWFILKGDMSLIGPRPLPEPYIYSMTEKHRQRYLVRPGLECPSLKKIENRTWGDQFDNDAWYVENVSLKTDIQLLLCLVKTVFNKKDNSVRGNAVRGSFIGYEKDGRSINTRKIPVRYYNKAQVIFDSSKRDTFTSYSYREGVNTNGTYVKREADTVEIG